MPRVSWKENEDERTFHVLLFGPVNKAADQKNPNLCMFIKCGKIKVDLLERIIFAIVQGLGIQLFSELNKHYALKNT